jgi:hypothetical protein
MWRLYGSYAHRGERHPGDFSPPVDVEVTIITRPTVSEATVVRAARIAIQKSIEALDEAGFPDIKEFSLDGQNTFVIGEVFNIEADRSDISLVSELPDDMLSQLRGQLL